MTPSPQTVLRPELIFALVGPAGVRLDDLSVALKEELKTFGYKTIDIRLSALLRRFNEWRDEDGSEFERITHLQKMGDSLRECLKDGSALARAGIAEIRSQRTTISGDPDRPASGCAFVVRQLKHPDEVELLREVYGSAFYLVAGHAPRTMRVKDLARQMWRNEGQVGQESSYESNASKIIDVDDRQGSEFGQNTRDTYPKADFFANMGLTAGEHKVKRFVDLLFGHPFHTPTPEEFAMYQASAVALRSSDDNRQVGAAIVSLKRGPTNGVRNADVIAVGMNEVPRGGGGFYWDGDSPDHRDQWLVRYKGEDRAAEIKRSALAELLERIRQEGWLKESFAGQRASELAKALLPRLKRTQFVDIGEFSRPVHAEMAALIDAARRGVAVDGHSMYVTTFPCHNCAKHIIAAGLRKVVYLEPYPKSRAQNLYGEEIDLESIEGKEQENQVVFSAFTGIAPRQYRQLFSVSERGAIKGRSLGLWDTARAELLPTYVTRNGALAYMAGEREELEKLPPDVYKWDKVVVCPAPEKGDGDRIPPQSTARETKEL